MRRGLAYVLFLVSGATALCYEVAWTRHLVLVFGSTTRAVSLILAAYMLGLALGSEAGGRIADRVKRPALLYAAAEALIGLYAFVFPSLVGGVRSAYLGIGTAATPVLFLGAFLLLLVPTFLMGATLPLLVRATVADPANTGSTVGRLYGANILGAVAGTALTGFWLMEAAGVMGATRWAAFANLAIGVVGAVALRGAVAPAPETAVTTETPQSSSPGVRAALVSAFSAGLVGLAAEVLWTRLLTFTLKGFTYTFSAMLATFLLGLALGGFAFARAASRTANPVRLLARLHVAVGVVAAAVLLALSYHELISASVWDFTGGRLTLELPPWIDWIAWPLRRLSELIKWICSDLQSRHIAHVVISSAIVLLPPAFLMGGLFPVAAAAYRRGLGDLGARIGRLYAVNTVGAVTGSLVAGFVLAPLAGLTWGAAWAAFLSIGAAVVVVLVGGGRREWRAPILGAVAVAGLVWAAGPNTPYLLRSHVFAAEVAREHRLVETRSGVVCQVSVVENERERYQTLYTDEFEAAGTKPEYRYMRLLAHLPVALAADPSRVLVICFGTGTTSGSVSTHSVVKRLDIVEISPEVLEVADRFRDVNKDVLHGAGRSDLDVAVHVDDGRNFVLRAKEQWGVITLEPLMPYTPAAIHLYTEDFYRECAPRLAPGGVMCQWIPLQGMSGEDCKRLVAAFVAVFPDSAVFFADGAVALIGGNEPLVLDRDRVAARFSDPAVKADLAAVGLDDVDRALATFVAAGAQLTAFTAGVKPVTDEHPVLEFHPIPPRVLLKHLWENLVSMRDLRAKYEELPFERKGLPSLGLHDPFRAGQALLDGQTAIEESGLLLRIGERAAGLAKAREARTSFRVAVNDDPGNDSAQRALESISCVWETGLGVDALKTNDFPRAEEHFRRATTFRSARQEDVAWTLLAETCARSERFAEALEAAIEATRLFPRGLDARCERAFARAALGDAAGARDDYERALEGESIDVITNSRLRHDAERAFATDPPKPAGSLDDRIRSALKGEPVARVPSLLVLKILAADEPGAFAQYFAPVLHDAADRSLPEQKRLDALANLTLARPPGTSAAASAALEDEDATPRLQLAASTLLAKTDETAFSRYLAMDRELGQLAAATRAAAVTRSPAIVDRLFALLLHDNATVRKAAHISLFARVGEQVKDFGKLDPGSAADPAYRRRVLDAQEAWRREREDPDSPR